MNVKTTNHTKTQTSTFPWNRIANNNKRKKREKRFHTPKNIYVYHVYLIKK